MKQIKKEIAFLSLSLLASSAMAMSVIEPKLGLPSRDEIRHGSYSLYLEKNGESNLLYSTESDEMAEKCGGLVCAPNLRKDFPANPGDTLKLVTKSDEGYELNQARIAIGEVISDLSCFRDECSFVMPSKSSKIDLKFLKNQYSITFTRAGENSVTTVVDYGDMPKVPDWECPQDSSNVHYECSWNLPFAPANGDTTYSYNVKIIPINHTMSFFGGQNAYYRLYTMKDGVEKLVRTDDPSLLPEECMGVERTCSLENLNYYFYQDEPMKLVVIPHEGYRVKSVFEDGRISDDNVYEFAMPDSNFSVNLVTEKNAFDITFVDAYPSNLKKIERHKYGDTLIAPDWGCMSTPGVTKNCHWDKEIAVVTKSETYRYLHKGEAIIYDLNLKNFETGKYSLYKLDKKYEMEDLKKLDNEKLELVLTNDTAKAMKICKDDIEKCALLKKNVGATFRTFLKLVVEPHEGYDIDSALYDDADKKVADCDNGVCLITMPFEPLTLKEPYTIKHFTVVYNLGEGHVAKEELNYGESPNGMTEHILYCRSESTKYTYSCHWDKEAVSVTENAVYSFVADSCPKTYSIIMDSTAESAGKFGVYVKIDGKYRLVMTNDDVHRNKVCMNAEDAADSLSCKSYFRKSYNVKVDEPVKFVALPPDSMELERVWLSGRYGPDQNLETCKEGTECEFSMIDKDVRIQYTLKKRQYEITFTDGIDSVTSWVTYNHKPDPPKYRCPKGDENNGATCSWDKEVKPATENTIYTFVIKTFGKANVVESSSSEEKTFAGIESSSSDSKKLEDKKEEHPMSIQPLVAPWYTVSTIGRDVQIAGAHVGSPYIIFDMQGRVMLKGRVDNANFNLTLPQAGSYMLRIGNESQKVTVR